MNSFIYGAYGQRLFNNGTKVDWTADTIKIALTTSSYTPDQDTHDFFDDVTNEVSGTGYSAGGATLANKAISYDSTNNYVKVDADDASWSSSTITNARYAIIYKSTGTASTSPLIALIDFGTNRSSNDSSFVIQWNANGIVRLAV